MSFLTSKTTPLYPSVCCRVIALSAESRCLGSRTHGRRTKFDVRTGLKSGLAPRPGERSSLRTCAAKRCPGKSSASPKPRTAGCYYIEKDSRPHRPKRRRRTSLAGLLSRAQPRGCDSTNHNQGDRHRCSRPEAFPISLIHDAGFKLHCVYHREELSHPSMRKSR
jgi:hypothetical protein